MLTFKDIPLGNVFMFDDQKYMKFSDAFEEYNAIDIHQRRLTAFTRSDAAVTLVPDGKLNQLSCDDTTSSTDCTTHSELVLRADTWLRTQRCKITINDRCRLRTENGEQPDCIGWRDNISMLVECKASRSDFLSDRHKSFRIKPDRGMGDRRYYMCRSGLIEPDEIPDGWGLLWVTPHRVKQVLKGRRFNGNKISENMMLVQALRRLEIRGYLHEIYDGII